MTATEMVTQIETMHGILAYNGSQVVCACDRTWKPAEDYAAHIARAVLAALTEAGTVEWGTMTPTGRVRIRVPDEDTARLLAAPHERVVSRLTLPWAEGPWAAQSSPDLRPLG